MASFLQSTDLGSDTDDEDYAPEKDEDAKKVLSEEEDEGDDEAGTKSKKKKTKKKAEPAARASVFEDKDESQAARKEFEKEKEEIKEEQEKKKVDDLWAAFKKDTSIKPKPKPKPVVKKPAPLKAGAKKAIGGGGSSAKPRSILSDLFAEKKDEPKKPAEAEEKPKETEDSSSSDPSKIKVTQVFDFAGESVKVTKELDKDSKEAQKILKQNPDAASAEKRPATGGLAAMMDSLTKKKKMGCLDKSQMDWRKFVDKEGLKEDLQTHNKGKDGYVNKQTFLEEVDLRRFEKEKEAREKTRKTLNR